MSPLCRTIRPGGSCRSTVQEESQKVYHQHRDRQRTAILEAAKKLFIQKGIQATTLGEIATAARVTRPTIYQYFPNQTEIAWALLEEFFGTQEEMWRPLEGDGTGYERLARLLSYHCIHWTQNPEPLRFLTQFDTMYARAQEVDRLLEITRRVLGGAPDAVIRVIREGIADGSLRPDLNPALTAAAILNMMAAMMARLEAHRTSVEVEYGYPPEQIFEEASRLLLAGMRNQGASSQ